MWFAVRTKARQEGTAERYLQARGVDVFLPRYKSRRRWSDRVKVAESPLFAGYLFVQIEDGRFIPVLESPGVVDVVGFAGAPAPIPEADITAIRRLVASGLPASPHPYLKAGDRVRIKGGPLDEMEGIFQRVRNEWRFILTVEMLQRAVSVEIDSEMVEPVR
jgi:transcription antitermination factor NusG